MGKFLKKLMVFALLSLLPFAIAAQGFDAELEDLAQQLAEKINEKNKGKIALWGFFSEGGKENKLGDLLAEDFSIYLANHAENFAVVDRAHLNILLKEHRLKADGYIDENTAKRLGKINAADAIVLGTYTPLQSEVKLRIKVLDTETALQVAGVIGNLTMDDNIAMLLGKL